MKEVINISEISYKVKEKTIIDNISFTVNEGESFALLGENGAGKSTLIDLMLNDLKPTKGTVAFFGTKKHNFTHVGIVYDHLPLFPLLKVHEIIRYFTTIHKLTYKNISNQYFDTFGINKISNSYIKELSQGERKKVGLLLAIIHNPDLLILDEPFANLDPTIIDRIWKTLNRQGRTIFFSTHNWKDVEKIATKIGFISKGKLILAPQSPNAILNQLPAKKKIIISSKNELLINDLINLNYYIHDDEIHIFLNNEKEIMPIINKHTMNFSIQDVGLKDAYLFYVKNKNTTVLC